jgi:hypothetical protein
MAKDDIIRNVQCLAQAAQLVDAEYSMAENALVERYPASRYDYFNRDPQPGRVFAYQFFDRHGRNCAYYLPDLNSVHFFASPRNWGMPKSEWTPVAQYARA